jgi:hypothetical protein
VLVTGNGGCEAERLDGVSAQGWALLSFGSSLGFCAFCLLCIFSFLLASERAFECAFFYRLFFYRLLFFYIPRCMYVSCVLLGSERS